MWLHVKQLKNGRGLPEPNRASPGDAGFDLRAAIPGGFVARINPGENQIIPTGFAWAIAEGWCGMVCPRSGLAAKHQITVGNSPGIVDSSYRGEVKVILQNHGETTCEIRRGDRIAQMVVVPVCMNGITMVDDLDDTDRGDGGFGSTGVK